MGGLAHHPQRRPGRPNASRILWHHCLRQSHCIALAALGGGTPAQPPPFSLRRLWQRSADNTSLILNILLTYLHANRPLEVGSLGMPLPFPWSPGSPDGDLASTFVDPSIGGQHGNATVTRLSGEREVLMITPADAGSGRCSLESWRAAHELP